MHRCSGCRRPSTSPYSPPCHGWPTVRLPKCRSFLCPMTKMNVRIPLLLTAGLLLAVVGGCETYDGPPLYPVSGTVTLDGKPLANAGVMYLPRGSTRGNACLGITDASGKYVLKAERGG